MFIIPPHFSQGAQVTSLYYTEDDPPLLLATNFTLADLDSSDEYNTSVAITVSNVADGQLEDFAFSPTYGIQVNQSNAPSVDTDFVARYVLYNGSSFSNYERVRRQ